MTYIKNNLRTILTITFFAITLITLLVHIQVNYIR